MKVTREQYEAAVQVIKAYEQQLESELEEVRIQSSRQFKVDSKLKEKELPKKGDTIEITEAFGISDKFKVGSRHKVTHASIRQSGVASGHALIAVQGGAHFKTNLYSYKIV